MSILPTSSPAGHDETMAALRQRADVVVLDSPSVAAATDALFLGASMPTL